MIYSCNKCEFETEKVADYFKHLNFHNNEYYNINPNIANMLDNCEQYIVDDLLDDGDILSHIIDTYDDEEYALKVLHYINYDVESSGMSCYDNETRLKKYLESIDYHDDLQTIADKVDYDTWEKWCHYTNDTLFTRCIEKGWKKFCNEFIKYKNLLHLQHKNITNAYEVAIDNGMDDLAIKIKNMM